MFGCAAIVAALLFTLLYIFHLTQYCCSKHPLMTNYPILGMLPPLLWNLFRIHDFLTDLLKRRGGTGEFMGPWFAKMNYTFTSDPINVHHMLSKSFNNYVKGPEFREIFQPFGEGIFTVDSDTWKYNRSLLHSLFKQRTFEIFLERTICNKVETKLLPMLEDHLQQQKTVLDLQDVFCRFTFDNICSMVLGYDPNCLSIDLPEEVVCEKAFNKAMESIFYRHIVPKCVWKLQEWLQIGQEKKMKEACETFDQFLYACIASKREELSNNNERVGLGAEAHVDLLTTLMREKVQHDDKFLRDVAFNLFVAGRDTIASALTWFFWLLATNPSVEAKIVEEMKDNNYYGSIKQGVLGGLENMVYLHGAICEALRLFPPIPFERKQAIKEDMLPSGHHVNPNTTILLSLYAMGRFEEIWGKDCLEFKPERWISERGKVVYAPSYKFVSFNAGPRTCLGKDLSFVQIKMVVIAILRNYRVQLVEGHLATPSLSIVLLMKHGLKVRISRREI